MSGAEGLLVVATLVGWSWGIVVWWKYRQEVVALLRQVLEELRKGR